MPFLMIKTNLDLEKTTIQALMNHASRVVAETVKKPRRRYNRRRRQNPDENTAEQ